MPFLKTVRGFLRDIANLNHAAPEILVIFANLYFLQYILTIYLNATTVYDEELFLNLVPDTKHLNNKQTQDLENLVTVVAFKCKVYSRNMRNFCGMMKLWFRVFTEL